MMRWSALDRIGVVLLGYAFFTFVGMVYVRRRRSETPGNVEKLLDEFLQQCGGVMKVVLIIGIEMFVFPLYCGVLLGNSGYLSTATSGLTALQISPCCRFSKLPLLCPGFSLPLTTQLPTYICIGLWERATCSTLPFLSACAGRLCAPAFYVSFYLLIVSISF